MDSKYVGVVENADEDLGRSEILLNAMKKGKGIVGNERSDEESAWSECPDHMLEMMFSSLPIEFSSRFRIVCKEWNSLLSSNKFLSLIAETDRWILLCNETHALAYSFLTQSWKTISLRFLPSGTSQSISQGQSAFCSSGAGLLLMEIAKPVKKYIICNPLTRTYRYLPAVIEENVNAAAIVDNGESYKILGLSKKENPMCIQIYRCFEKSWQIEVELPLPKEDFHVNSIWCAKGFLIYSSHDCEFVVWNMDDNSTQLVTFPKANLSIFGDKIDSWGCTVVVCGSSFLLVVTYLELDPERKIVNSHMIVWELKWEKEDRSIWKWKEITRMPLDMCCQFTKLLSSSTGLSPFSDPICPFSDPITIGAGNFLSHTWR
ncbi:hypothetical protein SUGI_1181560 [Cryptomeria japonica]|uniref:F-box only protein 6-like n=1 Tax=Cryptomeria japonica TaxID=3369 RepID=UPI0024148C3F|nr:F-box only protein 6-like [Cryptomeria japonica]GLJ55047.1 hypothetical protein SUGI_1181560 [Cryptomeria japonica]